MWNRRSRNFITNAQQENPQINSICCSRQRQRLNFLSDCRAKHQRQFQQLLQFLQFRRELHQQSSINTPARVDWKGVAQQTATHVEFDILQFSDRVHQLKVKR